MEPQVVGKLESLEGAGVVNSQAALEKHLKKYELNPVVPSDLALYRRNGMLVGHTGQTITSADVAVAL